MLGAVTFPLICQPACEIVHVATGLPTPGPVIGMALLFAGLVLRRWLATGDDDPETPAPLDETAHGPLNHLSLPFVPAGVGIVHTCRW